MPVFVYRGRYSLGSVKAMLTSPEDRSGPVARLFEQAGGRMLGYYVLFGEDDFLVIGEMPGAKEAAAVALTVAGSGGATDIKTTLAMTAAEAQEAFRAGQGLGPSYKAPGAGG